MTRIPDAVLKAIFAAIMAIVGWLWQHDPNGKD